MWPFKKKYKGKRVARPESMENYLIVSPYEDRIKASSIRDAEGAEWALSRMGQMIFLSGDDGLIQAQFSVEDFNYWALDALQLSN